MFAYNHPLLTRGAGRIKTDPINDERIETVLNRFEQYAKTHSIPLTYNIDGVQASRSKIVFPLAGFTVSFLETYIDWCHFIDSICETRIQVYREVLYSFHHLSGL